MPVGTCLLDNCVRCPRIAVRFVRRIRYDVLSFVQGVLNVNTISDRSPLQPRNLLLAVAEGATLPASLPCEVTQRELLKVSVLRTCDCHMSRVVFIKDFLIPILVAVKNGSSLCESISGIRYVVATGCTTMSIHVVVWLLPKGTMHRAYYLHFVGDTSIHNLAVVVQTAMCLLKPLDDIYLGDRHFVRR